MPAASDLFGDLWRNKMIVKGCQRKVGGNSTYKLIDMSHFQQQQESPESGIIAWNKWWVFEASSSSRCSIPCDLKATFFLQHVGMLNFLGLFFNHPSSPPPFSTNSVKLLENLKNALYSRCRFCAAKFQFCQGVLLKGDIYTLFYKPRS